MRKIYRIVLIVIVVFLSCLLAYSFMLPTTFSIDPKEEAFVKNASFERKSRNNEKYDHLNYDSFTIERYEFICPMSASWDVGGGGKLFRNYANTGSSIYKVWLKRRGDTAIDGPFYLVVTDIFGLKYTADIRKISKIKIFWIYIERFMAGISFKILDSIMIIVSFIFLFNKHYFFKKLGMA